MLAHLCPPLISLFHLSPLPPSCSCCFPLLILPKECARNEAFVFVQWAGAGSKLNWMFSPRFRSSYSPASPRTLCLVHYLKHPRHNPPYCAHQYEGCCFDSMQLFQVQKESLPRYALFGVCIEKHFFLSTIWCRCQYSANTKSQASEIKIIKWWQINTPAFPPEYSNGFVHYFSFFCIYDCVKTNCKTWNCPSHNFCGNQNHASSKATTFCWSISSHISKTSTNDSVENLTESFKKTGGSLSSKWPNAKEFERVVVFAL